MRHQLTKALRGHFDKEIERSLQHINDTVAPYTRFVRAERNKNTDVQETLQTIQNGLSRLQTQIVDL